MHADRYAALPDQNDRYALYQARLFDFGIKPTDKVLDVGSGHAPFPLATHLADLELSEGWTGRGGAPFKHIDGKPVYQCNIESLPFGDKEFDFVYCSHVLEHVDNPEIACRELMRVAKRGYIETPTRGKDLWMDAARQSNHKWAIEEFNGALVFTQYSERDIAGLGCDALMGMHIRPETPREKTITSLLYLKADLFNTMFMWDDSFAIEVRRLKNHSPAPLAPAPIPMPVPAVEPGHVFTCGEQASEDWLRQTTLRINQACGDPEKLVAIAGELAEHGHDDTAEELARMVISRDPSFADAHNVLGVIYYSRGKERDALRYFETANRLDPGNVDIGQNLITAYVDLEQHEKAVAVCQQMLQIRQNDPRLLEIIGNLVQTIGDRVADTLDGLNNQDTPAPSVPSQVPVVSGNPFPETVYKPKLKYSFGMIVLNGDDFIEYAIKSVYDFAHEIIIVEGAVQEAMFMVGPDGGSRDKTIDLIESFPDPDHKIRLIRGKWTDKTEQSNVYLRLATGDYVWQIDSDEVYKREDLVKLDEILAANQDSVDMVSITALNFYHNLWTIGKGGRWEAKEDPIRRIFKNKPGAHFTTHWPPTLVYGDGSTVVGHLEQDTLAEQFGIYFYHYSYVTRKQVEEKVEYYNRKGYSPVVGSDLSTWYDQVWSKWTHPGCEVEKLHGSHVNRRRPTWTEYFTGEHPEVMKTHPLFDFERPPASAPDSPASSPTEFWNLAGEAQTGCFAPVFKSLLQTHGCAAPKALALAQAGGRSGADGDMRIYNLGGRGDTLDFYAGKDASWLGSDIEYRTVDINPNFRPDICNSVEDMHDIPDASADILISTQVLMYSPNPHKAFQEISRVLTPGGTFFCVTPMLYPRGEPTNEFYGDCTRICSDSLLTRQSCLRQLQRFTDMYGVDASSGNLKQIMCLNDDGHHAYNVYDLEQAEELFSDIHAYPAYDSPKAGTINLVIVARK